MGRRGAIFVTISLEDVVVGGERDRQQVRRGSSWVEEAVVGVAVREDDGSRSRRSSLVSGVEEALSAVPVLAVVGLVTRGVTAALSHSTARARSRGTARGQTSLLSALLPLDKIFSHSRDESGRRWCYTTGWLNNCGDLVSSHRWAVRHIISSISLFICRYPNNPWSYNACGYNG